MDEDTLKRIYEKVRQSIVRISFPWKRPTEDECGVMVIPGLIISIDNGYAQILADSKCFVKYKRNKFMVNFPNLGGYEEAIPIHDWNIRGGHGQFCLFRLQPKQGAVAYIKAATFERTPLQTGDQIAALDFPRESQVVPLGCTAGSIVNGSLREVFFHDAPSHEYSYLGTPLFNFRGDCVGLTYLDFMRLHAWAVKILRDEVPANIKSILYVLDGVPEGEGEGPTAEAQVGE